MEISQIYSPARLKTSVTSWQNMLFGSCGDLCYSRNCICFVYMEVFDKRKCLPPSYVKR